MLTCCHTFSHSATWHFSLCWWIIDSHPSRLVPRVTSSWCLSVQETRYTLDMSPVHQRDTEMVNPPLSLTPYNNVNLLVSCHCATVPPFDRTLLQNWPNYTFIKRNPNHSNSQLLVVFSTSSPSLWCPFFTWTRFWNFFSLPLVCEDSAAVSPLYKKNVFRSLRTSLEWSFF